MGKLIGYGTLDLNQFWPFNKTSTLDSDGDTATIILNKEEFEFTSDSGTTKKTSVLFKAGMNVTNKSGEKKFKLHIKDKKVKVRFQGIDAPELHYGQEYMQRMGGTASYELHNFIKNSTGQNSGKIPCKLFTQNVNKPNDVFDKYGRFVGDILIRNNKGVEIDLNHWMVENGYAFPTYYNKMLQSEIEKFNSLLKNAAGKNIWKYYSDVLKAMDKSLVHHKSDSYNAKQDKQKPVIIPKMFRRIVEMEIKDGQTFSVSNLKNKLMKNKNDHFYTLKDYFDYINNKITRQQYLKKKIYLYDFFDNNGKLKYKTNEIAFNEAPTSIRDAKGNPITSF
ncbi:MAG: thermonuclease family protein [Ignavibacteria bacterium]|nr:thermonuclease family protein [Ignavibacteria bacterium]